MKIFKKLESYKPIAKYITNIEHGYDVYSVYDDGDDKTSIKYLHTYGGKYVNIYIKNSTNIIIIPNNIDKDEFVNNVVENLKDMPRCPKYNISTRVPFITIPRNKSSSGRTFITEYSLGYVHKDERINTWIIMYLYEYNIDFMDEETLLQLSPTTLFCDFEDVLACDNLEYIDILQLDHFKAFSRYTIVMDNDKPYIPVYDYSMVFGPLNVNLVELRPFYTYSHITYFTNPHYMCMQDNISYNDYLITNSITVADIPKNIVDNNTTKSEELNIYKNAINVNYSHKYIFNKNDIFIQEKQHPLTYTKKSKKYKYIDNSEQQSINSNIICNIPINNCFQYNPGVIYVSSSMRKKVLSDCGELLDVICTYNKVSRSHNIMVNNIIGDIKFNKYLKQKNINKHEKMINWLNKSINIYMDSILSDKVKFMVTKNCVAYSIITAPLCGSKSDRPCIFVKYVY